MKAAGWDLIWTIIDELRLEAAVKTNENRDAPMTAPFLFLCKSASSRQRD
jgi:hypothetical protein